MKSRKAIRKPLENIKRGRPTVMDRTKLKDQTMTICLTPDVDEKLTQLAEKNSQKKAAMARILIESGVDR
jgi:hypothetical protein